MTKGKVAIVGGGSGAWDLITVRGLRYLEEADVILYDSLVDSKLLDHARKTAKKISVGKRAGRHTRSQEEINNLLLEYALKGLFVVRLKGGDPLTFGRGEEECLYLLAHNIKCEIVPGVSSFNAAAARFLIPFAGRGISSSFAVATPIKAGGRRLSVKELSSIMSGVDSVLFLMSGSSVENILEASRRVYGLSYPLIAVSDLGGPNESIVILKDKYRKILKPTIIFAGEAAKWRASAMYYF